MMSHFRFTSLAAALGAAALFWGAAASGDQGVTSTALPSGSLVPVKTEVAPRIDGELGDKVWRDCGRRPAATAKDFIYRGLEGEYLAEEQTTVYAAYDDEALYFAFRCEVPKKEDIVASILLRDANLWYDDSVEVFLDSFRDRKSGYYFAVNPLNTQMDGYFSEEGEVENRNWDGVWYSAAKIDANAWTVEMKIPFRGIRYGVFGREWGINFVRFHKKAGDQTVWVDCGENLLRVSRFGTLSFPDALPRRPVVDVQPYVSGSYRDLVKLPEGTFGHKEGIDVASRVLPSVSIVGTYKPDFAQVEADPYKINLTDEELFYPEKRPFFLEGQEYFDTPIQVFYSRRVGAIDYGGKFLGRAGPTHLYALALKADESLADPDNPGGPYPFDFTVARVKQDITKYASLGLIGSRRTGETWRNNDVLGADAAVSFNDEAIFAGQFVRAFDGRSGAAVNGFDLALNRYTSGLSFGGGYKDLGKDLGIIRTAYIPYDNVKGYWATADFDVWLYKIGIKKLNWQANYEHYDNHGNILKTPLDPKTQVKKLAREGVDGEFGVYFENRISLRMMAESNYRQEIAKLMRYPAPYPPRPPQGYPIRETFRNRYYATSVGYNLEEWSSIYGFYEWGRHFDYDLQYWGLGYSINPLARVTLSYDMDYETLSAFESFYQRRYFYEFIINRVHVDYNITNELTARVFLQTTSDLGNYDTNALLAYEFRKGCFVYLVYNDKRTFKAGRRDEVGCGLIDQVIFLKADYIFGF
jgi:hypothetical protein